MKKSKLCFPSLQATNMFSAHYCDLRKNGVWLMLLTAKCFFFCYKEWLPYYLQCSFLILRSNLHLFWKSVYTVLLDRRLSTVGSNIEITRIWCGSVHCKNRIARALAVALCVPRTSKTYCNRWYWWVVMEMVLIRSWRNDLHFEYSYNQTM